MFWEIFIKLCADNNKKPNPVAKELGFGSSIVTYWKKGTVPNDVSLQKIANYFNVSVDYLLGKTEETIKKPTVTEDGELEDDVIIFHRDGKTQKRKFTKEQMAMLMAMVDAIPETPKEDI